LQQLAGESHSDKAKGKVMGSRAEIIEALTFIDILLPPTEYIREVLRIVCQKLNFYFGSVIQVDETGNGIMVSSYNLPDDYPQQVAQVGTPILASPSGEAIRTGKILVLHDPQSDPRLAPWCETIRPYGIKTMVWVPIMNKGKAFGTYVLYDTKTRKLEESILNTFEQVATLLSVAIVSNQYLDKLHQKSRELHEEIAEHMRTEESLRKLRDELEKRVTQRTAELAKANESLLSEMEERKKAEDERQKVQEQLQHAQKLESLGVLAGGIAHDFNNLLMGVLGNAELALQEVTTGSEMWEYLKMIENSAIRAADLSSQMLAYSGKGAFVIEPVDLSAVVDEMANLLAVSTTKKAKLQYNLAANLPAVEADATQIRQLVMNLITNGAEAIGEDSGSVSISTYMKECDRDFLRATYVDDSLPEGSYVCFEVADTGSGMDEETRARIFDPFFTTKFSGRGLGMAATLGIVRGHKGAIDVKSVEGRGTTVKVVFPTSRRLLEQESAASPAAGWVEKGTVLLVDDEEDVLTVAERMLQVLGHDVITATDGQEAVDVYRNNAGDISLVILDMKMPRMGGEEAFQRIREINNEAKVILVSGYDESTATDGLSELGLAGFLHKPFRMAGLREMLHLVLGEV
jgi:signal transduction histidine kinase